MKNNKKIIISSVVSILIVLSFLSFQKFQNKNADDNRKTNSTISSEGLGGKEANDDNGKTPVENAEDVSGKSGESETSSQDKDTKATENISNDQGIVVFVKGANFGSTAEIVIDSSKFKKDYKYYQFYADSKPVSKIESITILQTTIFPAQEAGSKVVLHLLDGNQKEIKKLDMILNEKK